MAGWLSPAGGVVYHLRARRHAADLWQPFRHALARWLADWRPATAAIVLVGPSAAYCLDEAFLARFHDVLVVEPDPLARWLLRRRMTRAGVGRVRFRRDDTLVAALIGSDASPSAGRGADLGGVLAEEPSRAVLFCNVLGQVRFLLPDDGFARWEAAFRARVTTALAGRPWASFHDRVSGAVAPDLGSGADADHALDDEEIVARFYGGAASAAAPHELLDHLTAGLWPTALPRRYFSWQVTPGRFHLIEGVRAAGR